MKFKPANFIWLSLIFSAAFWVMDAAMDSAFFYDEPFMDVMFGNQREIIFRSLVTLFFVAFGFYMSRLFMRHQETEENLSTANRQARDEAAKFESVLQSLGVGVIIQDLDYKIIYENKTQQQYVGNNVGQLCYKAYEGKDAICGHCPMIHSLQDGQTHVAEVDIPAGDELRHFELISSPLRDATGKIVAGIKVVKDNTELHRAESFIRDILKSIDDSLVVIDKDYKILSANQAYCRQMGMSMDNVVGSHCYRTAHGLEMPCHEAGEQCAAQITFKTAEPQTVRHLREKANGEPRHMESRSYPMKDAAGNVHAVILVTTDITDRLKLEQQSRHSQKMEALGTLTGGLAHEFNNIMTVISGFGEFLQEELKANESLRSYAQIITKSSKRAANLTESLLVYSRMKLPHMGSFDLNEVAGVVNGFLSRLVTDDIILDVNMSPGQLFISADKAQVEQVLLNIASNAIDAMPQGGKLSINIGPVELKNEFPDDIGPGEYALITFADTGQGMDSDELSKIFEPFFTTKDVGKGTGLGLSVVYGIIKKHGGHISVKSTVGEGTELSIYLPISQSQNDSKKTQQDHKSPVKVESHSSKKGSMGTVLLADDEEMVQKYITQMLSMNGYTVIAADDGRDAVQKYSEASHSIDLLLFDVAMPKQNGLGAYYEIAEQGYTGGVIFISGYMADNVLLADIAESNFTVLSKPLNSARLLQEVKAAIKQTS